MDKVELIYTKFVSLISSSPVIQTLLPLSPSGEVCDINGNCVDAADDEVFKLTTREGQLVVEAEQVGEPGPHAAARAARWAACGLAGRRALGAWVARRSAAPGLPGEAAGWLWSGRRRSCPPRLLPPLPSPPLPRPNPQVRTETADFDAGLIFEQDPVQIVDALLPLYMNASLLRSLQEALASELAARMNAMNNASDNAGELKRSLTLVMNRKRQAKITTEVGWGGHGEGGKGEGRGWKCVCVCSRGCMQLRRHHRAVPASAARRACGGERVAEISAASDDDPACPPASLSLQLTEIVAGASSV